MGERSLDIASEIVTFTHLQRFRHHRYVMNAGWVIALLVLAATIIGTRPPLPFDCCNHPLRFDCCN